MAGRTIKPVVISRTGVESDMNKIGTSVYIVLEEDINMLANVVAVFWSREDAERFLNSGPGGRGRWMVKEVVR